MGSRTAGTERDNINRSGIELQGYASIPAASASIPACRTFPSIKTAGLEVATSQFFFQRLERVME